MDVRGLNFNDESFDIAIDKGRLRCFFRYFALTIIKRYNGCYDDRKGGCMGKVGSNTIELIS